MQNSILKWFLKQYKRPIFNFLVIVSCLVVMYIGLYKPNPLVFLCLVFSCVFIMYAVNCVYSYVTRSLNVKEAIIYTFHIWVKNYITLMVVDGLLVLLTTTISYMAKHKKVEDAEVFKYDTIFSVVELIAIICTISLGVLLGNFVRTKYEIKGMDHDVERYNNFFNKHLYKDNVARIPTTEINNDFVDYLQEGIFEMDSFRSIESLAVTNSTEINFYKTEKFKQIIEVNEKRIEMKNRKLKNA